VRNISARRVSLFQFLQEQFRTQPAVVRLEFVDGGLYFCQVYHQILGQPFSFGTQANELQSGHKSLRIVLTSPMARNGFDFVRTTISARALP
jgi:hypothetical protein